MARKRARLAAERGSAWHWATVLAGGLLVAMALLAYALLARAGFIWDDEDYVVNNTTLRSLDGLRRIWFEIGAVRQYYPLVHSAFWIEYQLWKLAPLGYHLVNVLLHATSAVLLWRLLLRLQVPGAWLAAAIFTVHPVEVESVAWITERKNVLSLALALASMLCYLRFAPPEENVAGALQSGTRWRWYVLSFGLFAAALLSKTVVASLPAVLLVVFWWKRGRIRWADAVPLGPFFGLGISLGLLTVWMEKHHVGAQGSEWDFTPIDRLLIAGRALWFYAGKLVWPHPLVFFYPRWTIDAHLGWQYLYPAAALAVIAGLWLARARLGRGPLAAVLIFAGVLAPALGFFDVFPFRFSFVADHFQYHASVALIALAAAAGTLAAAAVKPRQRAFANVIAATVLTLLTAATVRQTLIYQNLETLYRDTIAHNPNGPTSYLNLAVYLDSIGRHDEAVDLMHEALPLGPTEPEICNNLGAMLFEEGKRSGFRPGQMDEVRSFYEAALRLNPKFAPAYLNMGAILFEQGKRDGFRPGQLDEAISNYKTALQFDPKSVPAHINIAEALIEAHQPDQAFGHLRVALELEPSSADAQYQMGRLFVERKEPRLAVQHYREALRLRPGYVEALDNLGTTLLTMGAVDEAIRYFNEALRLKPDSPQTKANLERALRAKGRGGTG
jgi:protein O-mannosyl-transferase